MEQAYLNLLQEILDNGQREPNRTGIDTLTLPGAMLKFDLREGFPAVTTKKLAWKAVVGELIGFLEGTTSLARFKELGCNVWDANAAAPAWQNNGYCKGPDDLGRIYGAQWRRWRAFDRALPSEEYPLGYVSESYIDQIAGALDALRNNPQSRRIIVNAWNPVEIDQAALPPCHTGFQLLPRSDGTLHMCMTMRSVDLFLGCPFNIASYALLLELFAAWSGRKAATLTMFLADAHIYVNHIDQVREQLAREVYPAPKLMMDLIGSKADYLTHNCADVGLETLIADLDQESVWLNNYQHHDAIKAPMAV